MGTTTTIVKVSELKLHNVVRLPEGNAEVVFVKVSPKTTQVTFMREQGNCFGGRMKNDTTYETFVS